MSYKTEFPADALIYLSTRARAESTVKIEEAR